jgi:hypothetical protein
MPEVLRDPVELALEHAAARIAYPRTPSIAPAVGARLRADAVRAHRPPFAGIAAWPRRRVVVALALAFLLFATAAVAAGRLRIGAIGIEVTPTPLPSAPAEAPAVFGPEVTLRQAVGMTRSKPRWPPSLGRPDDVYVVSSPAFSGAGLVLAWRHAPDLEPIPGTPWNAVLYELPGDAGIATKYVGAHALYPARVAGRRAYWISGAHDLSLAGVFGGQPFRVSGNVLIWQREPAVTYRLESELPEVRAIALAEELGVTPSG